MIDLFTIFHRGGAVLYSNELNPVPGHPVNSLISNILLEERTGTTSYRHEDKYTVKWTLANDLDLVFVAVYLNLTNLLYLDELLAACKEKFCSLFRDAIKTVEPSVVFTKKFNPIFDEIVRRYEGGKGMTSHASTPAVGETTIASPDKKPQHSLNKKPKVLEQHQARDGTDEDEAPLFTPEKDQPKTVAAASESPATTSASAASSVDAPVVNQAKLAALQQASRTGVKPVHQFGKKKPKPAVEEAKSPSSAPTKPDKRVKLPRESMHGKISAAQQAELDYARKIDGVEAAQGESTHSGFDSTEEVKDRYTKVEKVDYSSDEDDGVEVEDEEEEETPTAAAAPKKSGGFFSFFKTLVAGKVLERSDLEPVLAAIKENLNGKNVAADISEQLAESVMKTLEGQKLASFTSIKTMVKKAVEAALTRILTPNRQIDVLAGVMEANEQKRPYSIVFVGVNGVGKSTSLAKTASYFLTKGLTVGVGACDTFRAGAIEQLRTHTKALQIPLYARGYDRDAASVAQDAIAQARHDGLNVVLIDTAGRMQHNEPLMRALAKLITLNKPDLVLFVGEALVGNDAVDQVKEFNRALSDLSDEKKPRLIDGIILTKFDTIDDKVGAAISMAYVTGQPILFVGTGQTYADLKRMNVKTLIRALLK